MKFTGLRGARVFAAVGTAFLLAAPAAGAADRYVALGDSFSSGVGTGSYSLSSACKRSVYAYPYLLSQQRADTSLSFVACSGATTADLLSSQLPTLDSSPTSIVTLTIGGNDIGFASLIQQCTLSDCTAALGRTTANLAATLTGPLNTTFAAVRQAAPDATVIVLGYPHVFSTAMCFGTLGISAAEEKAANTLADALDSLIAGITPQYGFTYESALVPWTGHAVCSSSPWLNGLNLLSVGDSYHPTKAGYSAGYLPLVAAVTG